ncbi:MAG: hypothetical protein IJ280_00830 [Bacteroidales bacterium]|nr:hypothetical protein [Bacteroidales bacterium]
MKKVLILNGSFCELPIIEECHKQGFYVITTGNMPDLMAHKYADEYIQADYSDYEAILSIVKEHNIDHILTCANDFGCITSAYVDEQMGWHNHDSFEVSKILHHKDLFKEYIQGKNYPTPYSIVFNNIPDAYKFVDEDIEYPIIVKANDLTGGKGILKAETKEDAIIAIDNAFSKSRTKHILIEPFITGDQQTFVSFIHNKKVIASSSCDSYSYINPYLIQAETLPAKDILDVQDYLISIIEEIATDLDLSDGIFAFQYIRNGKDVQIIEMMRRPFGNQFLQLVEMNSGFPWHRAQVTAETGGDWTFLDDIDLSKCKIRYCGHYGIMVDRDGILKSYNVPDTIRKNIIKEFVMKSIGDRIEDHMNERVAFLHFEYNSYEEMNSCVRDYNKMIKVEIE